MCTCDRSAGFKGQGCIKMGLAAHNKFYFPRIQGKAIITHPMLDFILPVKYDTPTKPNKCHNISVSQVSKMVKC